MIKAWRRCIFIAALAFAAPTIADAKTYSTYNVQKTVQMLAGPGNGKVVGTVRKGWPVDGTGNFSGMPTKFGGRPVCKNGWCYIAFEGKRGYIPAGSFKKESNVLEECDDDDIELGTCFDFRRKTQSS